MGLERFIRNLSRAIEAGTPVVFRQPEFPLPATLKDLYAGALNLAARYKRGDRRSLFRFYRGGALVVNGTPYLANRRDRSWQGYLNRLARQGKGPEFGLIISDFQGLEGNVFSRTLDMLSILCRKSGIPPGGASVEIFAGNYRKTAFGVHKDEQAAITFVLSGRKKILLWPFKLLKREAGVGKNYRRASFALPSSFSYEPFRDLATVLDGEAGDIFVWPADWWHVAESDGSLVTTIKIGMSQIGDPFEPVREVADQLWREGYGRQKSYPYPMNGNKMGQVIAGNRKNIQRTLEDEVIIKGIQMRMLSFLTASGFHVIPEPARPVSPLSDSGILRIARPGSLCWIPETTQTVLLGACGHLFQCAAHPRLLKFLNDLARGKRISVMKALDQYCGSIETERTQFLMSTDDLREILSTLIRFGAIVVE